MLDEMLALDSFDHPEPLAKRIQHFTENECMLLGEMLDSSDQGLGVLKLELKSCMHKYLYGASHSHTSKQCCNSNKVNPCSYLSHVCIKVVPKLTNDQNFPKELSNMSAFNLYNAATTISYHSVNAVTMKRSLELALLVAKQALSPIYIGQTNILTSLSKVCDFDLSTTSFL